MYRNGDGGKESPEYSACLGAEAIGEKVDLPCFYPFRVNHIEAAY